MDTRIKHLYAEIWFIQGIALGVLLLAVLGANPTPSNSQHDLIKSLWLGFCTLCLLAFFTEALTADINKQIHLKQNYFLFVVRLFLWFGAVYIIIDAIFNQNSPSTNIRYAILPILGAIFLSANYYLVVRAVMHKKIEAYVQQLRQGKALPIVLTESTIAAHKYVLHVQGSQVDANTCFTMFGLVFGLSRDRLWTELPIPDKSWLHAFNHMLLRKNTLALALPESLADKQWELAVYAGLESFKNF